VAHPEVEAEDRVLVRLNGHRRRSKISTPRWRLVLDSTSTGLSLISLSLKDYTASNAAPAAAAAA